MVMGGDSSPKGRGFESQRWILDGHDIFTHLLQKLYCLFEKTENKRKRGRGWPIFFKKNHFYQNASLAWQKPISKDPIFPKRANPGLLFVYFCPFSLQFQCYKSKKHRWSAWDFNPRLQDGRLRQIR